MATLLPIVINNNIETKTDLGDGNVVREFTKQQVRRDQHGTQFSQRIR